MKHQTIQSVDIKFIESIWINNGLGYLKEIHVPQNAKGTIEWREATGNKKASYWLSFNGDFVGHNKNLSPAFRKRCGRYLRLKKITVQNLYKNKIIKLISPITYNEENV